MNNVIRDAVSSFSSEHYTYQHSDTGSVAIFGELPIEGLLKPISRLKARSKQSGGMEIYSQLRLRGDQDTGTYGSLPLYGQAKLYADVEAITPHLTALLAAFDEARDMLEWEDNWDDAGSPSYSEETWSRARNFILELAQRLQHSYIVSLPIPRVSPGPDGSIDIHWRIPNHELLLNVPANASEPITFYGDTPKQVSVKGNLTSAATSLWLPMWLTT